MRSYKCNTDPSYDKAVNQQIADVLTVSRSDNASASLGTWGHASDEAFDWGNWFGAVFGNLGQPVCGPGVPLPCSFAALPWPCSQAAGAQIQLDFGPSLNACKTRWSGTLEDLGRQVGPESGPMGPIDPLAPTSTPCAGGSKSGARAR